MTTGSQILFQWEQRKEKVEHDYYIAGWALSAMPVVQDNVVKRMTGVHRDAIERVFKKLHKTPCTKKSKETEGKNIGDILHMFWLEFKDFQHKTGPFDEEARWLTNTALVGKSHVWNELYSLPYTGVLCFIACRVYDKTLRIGPCERSWGYVNNIKTGKR